MEKTYTKNNKHNSRPVK